MIKKLLAVLAAIGGIFSAVFYVLFKHARAEKEQTENEKKQVEQKLEEQKAINEGNKTVISSIKKQEAENEKLKQESKKGDNLNAFNAGIDRLHKSAQKGADRNSAGNNRA